MTEGNGLPINKKLSEKQLEALRVAAERKEVRVIDDFPAGTLRSLAQRGLMQAEHRPERGGYWWYYSITDAGREVLAAHQSATEVKAQVVNPIYEPELDPRLPTRCACCDLYIGERDEQNPALCANCGAYVAEQHKAAETTHNLWVAEKDRYQILYHQHLDMQQAVEHILYTADASADGHEEINEDTPEAYIKLLEGRLMLINRIARAVLNGEDWASV